MIQFTAFFFFFSILKILSLNLGCGFSCTWSIKTVVVLWGRVVKPMPNPQSGVPGFLMGLALPGFGFNMPLEHCLSFVVWHAVSGSPAEGCSVWVALLIVTLPPV